MPRAKARIRLLASLFFICAAGFPALSYPWEKRTADKIVSTALASLPAEIGAFLKEEQSFLQEGLQADPGTAHRYAGFSAFDMTGYAAGKLAGQISLLRDLFPSERSAYMAYRMGLLTVVVMDLDSPLATATDPRDLKLRERFARDVEAHLAELGYAPRPPHAIRDPLSFVGTALSRSAGWAGPIRSQYLTGKGYNFIVRQAASRFYGEAVNGVADVLCTIGAGKRGDVAGTALHDFYRDACVFYLRHGMGEKALEAYRRVGEIASAPSAADIGSLEAAVERYEFILQVFSLEETLKASGIGVTESAGEKLMETYLPALSRLAEGYIESGQEDKARTALSMCLREKHDPERTLQSLRKLYGLDKLKDVDVPENAWKIYLEANGFESMAGKAYAAGRLWAANDSFVRAAALYSAIPGSARDLRKASRARIDQIVARMGTIPPSALLSEELFQSAVDSLAEGDIDSAVRGLHMSQRWGPADKAVGGALADAESLQLFVKGKELFEAGKREEGVRCFQKLIGRFPGSPFAGPARKMVELYEKRKALERGRLLLLLKGAYEASFVGDEETVFGLCDEILASGPADDFRDRAELLIAVAWYQSRQKGYLKIERVFKNLLKHKVLEVDDGRLELRKRIDFYFGLGDSFPGIELADLDESMRAKLDLEGLEAVPADAREAAQGAIEKAKDEIDEAEELITRGEGEERDMGEARSLLEAAKDLLNGAIDRFDEGAFSEAAEAADEAFEKASEAREKAEGTLEAAEDLKGDAEARIEEAKSAISSAESAIYDAEDERGREFDRLRSDLDGARDLLEEAQELFDDGDYGEAEKKASEAADKAEEVRGDAEGVQEDGGED